MSERRNTRSPRGVKNRRHNDMEVVVAESIEKFVNGHIRKLTTVVEKVEIKFDNYVVEDMKWKADAQEYREKKLEPIVENRRNWNWAGGRVKAIAMILVLIAGAMSAWGVIKNALR